jgi:hypothetical protein
LYRQNTLPLLVVLQFELRAQGKRKNICMKVKACGPWFQDEDGRKLILRGVNISGSSKVPSTPNGATHLSDGFYEHRNVSFVGRPFPLEEADEHLTRLRAWGLTVLRLIVPWEAIEHSGPGIYDTAYLDYLRSVVQKAGEYGFLVIIDPHQDVWSRFSGGDGAPGWTLEAVGLDVTCFHEAGAAIIHQEHGDPFPPMVWPTNGMRVVAATMLTLFFGGNDFAPETKVNGEPIQEFLQRHYLSAYQQVADRLKDLDCVIGYEVFNEPLSGFIGLKDLTRPTLPVRFGPIVSPIQSMLLGDGIPQEIEIWERTLLRSQLVKRQIMNPKRLRIWREGIDGVWQQNGVWDLDEKGRVRILRPHHFACVNDREVDFSADYVRPFINRFAAAIREIVPEMMIFIETDPRMPPPRWGAEDAKNVAYAPHWYDATVLFLKTYSPWIGFDVHTSRVVLGRRQVQRSFARQLAKHKEYSARFLGNVPVLFGEIGIAYDLNGSRAYRTKNFFLQVRAMDRTLRAADENLLSYTIWNYTPDNDNVHGDQWNGEDLSIFSGDQRDDENDIHSGGRALEAVVRPYARATAGEPTRMSYDVQRRIFVYEFRHEPNLQAPTEIFVPNLHYPRGYNIWVTDGECELDMQRQVLFYTHSDRRSTHRIRITPR